jgi:sialate O-acetylesterase
MIQFKRLMCLWCAWLAVTALPARGDVKLPALFGDHMVLQQNAPLPVWGTADPGEEVTVSLGRNSARATADDKGRWSVKLPACQLGEPAELIVAGKNHITIRDVLVGEVWVCSGQSNMEWSVRASANAQQEIAAAKYPKIRLFTVQKRVAAEPVSDVVGHWSVCGPESVAGFSAVGYFFGRTLHQKLDVPIGLINSSWGGTPAESWTTHQTLESNPELAPIAARWKQLLVDYPKAKAAHEARLAEYRKVVGSAKAAGKPAPRPPGPPLGPDHPHRASGLYNGMIAPLVPFAIPGAIWYPGESNAGRAYQYRTLFPAMIQDWRRAWGQGEFPFLFVQLANFRARSNQPEESDWAELREAQSKTLALPNTAQAVIIDIGEANDIHPKNKQDVGYRLAVGALKVAYRQDVVHSGPVYASMAVEGEEARLKFKHAGGLVAKGGPLKGFAIAGADRKFVWADARIDGDTVVVCSDFVKQPVAVRYAWGNNPECNLYNKEGLPASPFRTDDWPGVTAKNR